MRHNILFFIGKDGNNDCGRLRCRVKWGRNTTSFALGFNVERAKWSPQTQRCIKNTFHADKKVSAAVINKAIADFERKITAVFDASQNPTKDAIRSAVIGKGCESKFFTAFDLFMVYGAKNRGWTIGTINLLKSLRKNIALVDKNIRFEDFEGNGFTDFTAKLQAKMKYKNSTLRVKTKTLRWFLNWAYKNNHMASRDYQANEMKIKMAGKQVVYLPWDELMRLYNCELKDKVALVRDIFCLCCFTSLRISDTLALTTANITDNAIVITTKKTNATLTIDLNKYSREILDRHMANCGAGRLFPKISLHAYQGNLRKAAMLCGIDTPITQTFYRGSERVEQTRPKYLCLTSHTARRTFICNALILGIPAEVVMKWTGHSDYNSMKPYIDVADKVRRSEMKKFDR